MAISESTSPQLNCGKGKSFRRLTVSYIADSRVKGLPPHLRIKGRWLEEAGFPVGTKVNVEVSHGRLVIERAPPEQECEVTSPMRPFITERMLMAIERHSSQVGDDSSGGGAALNRNS
jgi:hypothetical protein